MFSKALFNSATIEGMLEAPGSKWHRDPPDVIPLWLADMDFPVAMEIKKALLNAVQDEDLFYNTDDLTRKAMAEKISNRNGISATADDIFITQGVNPAMWLAIRHACLKGEEVIVTNPMYFPFFIAIEATNTKPVYWGLKMEDDYKFNVEKLKEKVSSKTKLIFVCNPHNPTGRVMTKEELKGIADIAVDHEIKVFVDELWEDIVFDGRKHVTLASLSPEIERLTMTCWGFSKTFGVAGLQMGYVCSTDNLVMNDIKKKARGVMRGTSTLSKAAAPVMLDHRLDWWRRDIMEHLHMIRDICYKRLDELPNVCYPKLEGTYLMYPKFDYGKTSEELQKYMLAEARLSFSNGTQFGSNGKGHLRLCVATSEAIINEVFDRMEKTLSKLK
jgi:bifunctional pyridoxal-dependent enzyme with beta-cystathionase and maltose regulon repressor activities